MKRHIILTTIAALSLLTGCIPTIDEPKEVDNPATISGEWVFSEVNTGDGWTQLDIDKVYEFDGSGEYVVKDLERPEGVEKVTFSNGCVSAEASWYKLKDVTWWPVRITNWGVYKFGSLDGGLKRITESDTLIEFERSDGTGIKLKLEKVVKFEAPQDPTPEEPEPEDPNKINGTVLMEGYDLVGLISESTTGRGIPGVVVSDGYDCVATDANGVYQLKSNSLTRLIYYSTPAEYKIETSASPSVPVFYKSVKPNGTVQRNDFTLTPLAGGKENQWIFVGIGDPQCATTSNASRYTSETIPDIKNTLSGKKSVYAMTLGDITFDSANMWPNMKASMASVSNGADYIPFFQTLGNHDHDSRKDDTSDDAMDDYNATSTFVSYYGPTDYSFNRGDVHVIAMDDIIVSSKKTSSKSNGYTWSYSGGFTDAQYKWLQKDISLVKDKANKMVFICCHIQFRNSTSYKNVQNVLTLLQQFKEAHIMIGHTHYTQNFVYPSSRKALGGLPIYEHIHGAACGAWWTSSSSSTVTGEPNGYTWYEIDGAHIKDWHFKGTRRDNDFQFRVFDGNEIYYQSGYPLNWYTASQKIGSYTFTVKGNTNLKGCFVAQVFNDDDTYWTVEMYRKSTGVKIGTFTRLANGTCTNIAMSANYYNKRGKTSDSYCSTTASHYWYYKPASGNPASETDWEVVVKQKLPGNSAEHTFKCSKLTVEADFDKDFWF